jgi:hypothetical protein
MKLIDSLPTALQAAIVVIVFAGVTISGLYLVRRRVPSQKLKDDHDVAGFTFGLVGAFYGVILAFVIVAVWQRFEQATGKAQDETLAVSNLYHLSQGFDDPMRSEMKAALRIYLTNVLNNDWDAMAKSSYRLDVSDEARLWHVLLKYTPATAQQQIFLDKSIDQMALLSDAHRLRYIYSTEDLPPVVWIVIYVGCVITLGFSYFFATRMFGLQAIMCGTFAALIGLTILAISELANPYQGAVTVSDQSYRYVLSQMSRLPPPHASGGAPSLYP